MNIADEVEEGRRRLVLLYEASVSGSVSQLEQLMADDPLTLARAAVTCFNETPLHIAAMLDHLHFTLFLLDHKPDMTTALDSQGRSPLHLASSNGYPRMVEALLSANPDACLIRDEDGRTPLHLAIMKGTEIEVVGKLFEARPEVIRFNSDHQGETTLHLAVKQNRLAVLKLLLQLLGLGGDHQQVVQFLNSRDDYGNTLLHTATALKQFETVKYLVGRPGMEVNAQNENRFTALDIILNMSRDVKGVEIRDCLVKAGALSCRHMAGSERGSGSTIQMVIENPQSHPPPPPTHGVNVTVKEEGKAQRGDKMKKEWTKKKRDSVMIAATLITGMTFQLAVNPPGGVWDDDKGGGKLAGESVMAHRYPQYYDMYMTFNTMTFFGSLSMVFLVVSGVPFLKRRILTWILMILMWIILTFIASTYLLSMIVISPTNDGRLEDKLGEFYQWPDIIKVVEVSALAWWGVVGAVVLVHILRFLLYCLRKLFWSLMKIFKWIINYYWRLAPQT